MKIQFAPTSSLNPNPRNARTHSKKQVSQIANSIKTFSFLVPIVADETSTILAGHGRHAAALMLNLPEVPVVFVSGLSPAKKRALALAENKIAENAGWDREMLATELAELSDILVADDLDISITGFVAAEIDQLSSDFDGKSTDPDDEFEIPSAEKTVTSFGDLWILGKHRLLCGDARSSESLERLMDGSQAAMAFCDPPFNVRVREIVGRGQVKHSEFAMASGEMSRAEFVAFLNSAMRAVCSVSENGSVHFICMDWRHISELIEAGEGAYNEMLNLAVWVKSNAGQGSFYRSQHELIGVFRVGDKPHQNNIELGRFGRNRSNVWHYAGVNSFRKGRQEDLEAHPTVKPIALVADAIKDCTRRGDIVIDTFSGSGTTILAAERVGRRAFAMELERRFVDVAIRRWQEVTRRDAVHAITGRSYDEMAAERCQKLPTVIKADGERHDKR
jgi:DNA modification methylase